MSTVGKTALVLGGCGLVGQAVCRRLAAEGVARILVAGLTEAETGPTIADLARHAAGTELVPVWGNLFVRTSYAFRERGDLARDQDARTRMLADDLGELDAEVYRESHLVQLLLGTSELAPGMRPDIVVDAVNTATALAYGGVYPTVARALELRTQPEMARLPDDIDALLAAHTVPKLVRHIQLLSQALIEAGTDVYVKIGTTGTGGMGLNIPYTHGEEKPSRVLLTKSALAGAHSMLLFVLARTPGAPVVKEIKPAATITWKRIAFGPIRRGGVAIGLHDCAPEDALRLEPGQAFNLDGCGNRMGVPFESVFIDTGENGLFSLGEYTAITALGQMEAVTPEEIAAVVVREIEGRSTGRDVVAALDAAVMGPGYRAGSLRASAIDEAERLVEEHGASSIAFEVLGPPRLSKLLYEAELLRRAFGSLRALANASAPDVCARWAEQIAEEGSDLRRAAISVGVPILLADGERLLCAERDAIFGDWERPGWSVTDERIEHWSQREWIDLRPANAGRWIERAGRMVALQEEERADRVRSSGLDRRFARGFDIGEVAAWIFEHEDAGYRL